MLYARLTNEWYARDISKKRRISNKIKGNSGEPMGPPPYGYMKDPDNAKRWIVDEEAAAVVRRIFDMTLSGLGTMQVAERLEADYNCIGVIDIPADLPLPAPSVSVNTRKGVTVTYVPMPLAS